MVDVLAVLLISLIWDDLKDQIAGFVQMGLAGYGRDRPIALSGVLAAYSMACLALMTLLGAARIPSRFVR